MFTSTLEQLWPRVTKRSLTASVPAERVVGSDPGDLAPESDDITTQPPGGLLQHSYSLKFRSVEFKS